MELVELQTSEGDELAFESAQLESRHGARGRPVHTLTVNLRSFDAAKSFVDVALSDDPPSLRATADDGAIYVLGGVYFAHPPTAKGTYEASVERIRPSEQRIVDA